MANENRLKAWPGTNIAKRIAVKDIKDLERLLLEYHRLYPEHLPHGVKGVLPADKTDDFFMATDGKGLFWFAEMEYKGFNSRTDLLGGFAAIKAGNDLTRNEEYALESLWHEILHNRQTSIERLLSLDYKNPYRLLAETLNQYVSRLTYPGFIEKLGGKSIHQQWVMNNGYGYAAYVQRMKMIFEKTGVDKRITGDLFNINFNQDLLNVNELLTEAIIKKSTVDRRIVSSALFAMIVDPVYFAKLLRKLDPS